ncbi:glycosyltransferase family 4 protein [Cellulomonas sp.]|uniref:glycosyltransferase family 4 protein n=1 Tax=Cellulomonas sp. TaxID=40001 RepID=UPI0028126C15|nr:glycosyltransferase family 4 protein [Cellulomonas sp.]
MHIVLLTHHYVPETGAPQRRWSAFVQRFMDAGHRVTVLTPPPHYPAGRLDTAHDGVRPGTVSRGAYGETVVRVRFREHDHSLLSRTSDQLVAASDSVRHALSLLSGSQDRPDVVVATAPGLPSIPAGMLLGRLLRRPAVVEMRDAWPDLIASSGMWGPGQGRGLRARATTVTHESLTLLQRRAAAVVTTTVSFADVLSARGVPRVAVVRNGAHVPDLPLLPPPGRGPGELRVLYLGTMGRSQGLETAVQAADLVRRRGVQMRLRLVGSGADVDHLSALARELDAPVDVLARVPADEVLTHYAWADTTLVSLRDWGPFEWTIPSKMYELFAVGRHVSASLAGEAARVVEESGAGDVVVPQSPLALADLWCALAAERARLDVGRAGRLWVEQNADHDRLATAYLELLAQVRT